MADLTLAPDYTFDTTPSYSTIVSEFENGVEQRRARRATSIRKWRLGFINRTSDDVSTIQTLFDSMQGKLTAFVWTNPLDSQDYNVRFSDDEITFINKSYGIFDFEIGLTEVL
jgi:uncharacterized protein (TIGR02217 family)